MERRFDRHHFHPDEHQHHRETGFQVAEIFDGAGQHEIERPQAEDGEYVRGKDDEGIRRDRENGGK